MEHNGIAHIAYGKSRIPLRMDENLARWHVITPDSEPPLLEPKILFKEACRNPIASAPLRELIKPNDRVVIVTSDGTRPVPNRKLIAWILEELPVPLQNVTVMLGTGTHRPNTHKEIEQMFGIDLVQSVKIVNHNAFDTETNKKIATSSTGADMVVDRAYLEADKRIVVGFIEPHFFAGFSGGAKGIIPGVAGIDTILHLHNYELIGHPKSTYGVLDGNPIHEEIAEMVAHCPPDFMVNVTLNPDKEITGFFVGDYRIAHRQGCDEVKSKSMAPVENKFPIVVTSNSGFPLDQNLYQTVKGISAAARIVEEGGVIFVVSECSDGIPAHGNFGSLFNKGKSPAEIIESIRSLEKPVLDQWQAQILATIMEQSGVEIFSALDPESISLCPLHEIEDLQCLLYDRIQSFGRRIDVAVLPDGPLTIPYVATPHSISA